MEPASAFQSLAISLGLGLLVGLQRQRAEARVAGLRTFTLITVLGTLCALAAYQIQVGFPPPAYPSRPPLPDGTPPAPLSGSGLGWLIVVAGLIGVLVIASVGNLMLLRHAQRAAHTDGAAANGNHESAHAGITTEVAILAMFIVGVLVVTGPGATAVVVGGGVAVLLQAKTILHTFAARLGDRDLRAVMQFALIWLVVLPILPDRTFDPYHVLNPHSIWLMVVLIVGISLGGYIAYRFLPSHTGLALAGLLGGLVSSTATTASFARRAHSMPDAGGPVLVVMLASTVLYLRILVEIGVVAPNRFLQIAPPILIMFLVSLILSLTVWFRVRRTKADLPEQGNPTELRAALTFAAIYAGVLLAVAAAKQEIGSGAIYPIAALSGTTDMDAITLSVSGMARENRVEAAVAWRAILIALIASMVFKTGIVAAWGTRRMLKSLALLMGVSAAAAIALLLLWPAS